MYRLPAALGALLLGSCILGPGVVASGAINIGAPVNSSATEAAPEVASDGLTLYFSSNAHNPSGPRDIFVATRGSVADPWGVPSTLGPTVNSPLADDGAPNLAADGLTLYFDSGRSGGAGQLDLWSSTRASTNDPWSTPANLGATVNSGSVDSSPSVSSDGLALFFYSTRPGGEGAGDLWIAERPSTAEGWSSPVNLGSVVNTAGEERDPAISLDGLTLLFASDRAGSFDVWQTTRASVGVASYIGKLAFIHLAHGSKTIYSLPERKTRVGDNYCLIERIT